ERLSLLLLDQLAQDRQPLPARGLFLPPLDPARPLRLADGMHHHVAEGADGSAVLHWTCGHIPLSAEERGWVAALAEGAAPAALGEAALPFIERLRRIGLLEEA
ncbi:MAG: hypothetical protein RMK64_14145, partial [Rhodovarius sp.]|nr:hypothetical protein [Rhodovarius sp.]